MINHIIILFVFTFSITINVFANSAEYCQGLDKSTCPASDTACAAKKAKVIEDCNKEYAVAEKEIDEDLKNFQSIRENTEKISNKSVTPELLCKELTLVPQPTTVTLATTTYTVNAPSGCSGLTTVADNGPSSLTTATEVLIELCKKRCVADVPAIKNNLSNAIASVESTKPNQIPCATTHAKAKRLCVLSSPQAQMGSMLMDQLLGRISNSSAKDTCDQTGLFSNMGNAVIATGALVCGNNKDSCIQSCKAANTNRLGEVQSSLATAVQLLNRLGVNYNVSLSTEKVVKELEYDSTNYNGDMTSGPIPVVDKIISKNTGYVTECSAYASGFQALTQTAMGLLQRAQEAKICSAKLAGGGGENQTIDVMCSDPAMASTSTCLCRNNNSAQGCPGYLATIKNEGNLKLQTNPGASNLAGFSAAKTNTKGDIGAIGDIGDEAKAILATENPKDDSSVFGNAGAASAGGGGSTSPGSGDKGGAGKAAEEGKSLAGTFSSAMSSLFGRGGSGGGKGGGANDKYLADKYKQAQRQIAADQLRSEISGPNGTGNFEKVKKRYIGNLPTFIEGQ